MFSRLSKAWLPRTNSGLPGGCWPDVGAPFGAAPSLGHQGITQKWCLNSGNMGTLVRNMMVFHRILMEYHPKIDGMMIFGDFSKRGQRKCKRRRIRKEPTSKDGICNTRRTWPSSNSLWSFWFGKRAHYVLEEFCLCVSFRWCGFEILDGSGQCSQSRQFSRKNLFDTLIFLECLGQPMGVQEINSMKVFPDVTTEKIGDLIFDRYVPHAASRLISSAMTTIRTANSYGILRLRMINAATHALQVKRTIKLKDTKIVRQYLKE